jgi:hypothetical protein
VEDLARAARVTTGALLPSLPHQDRAVRGGLRASAQRADGRVPGSRPGASDDLDELGRGFEAFLDAVLEPDLQRILIIDGPAVLGLARYTELDERYAFASSSRAFLPRPRPARCESTIPRPPPGYCWVQ